jgi:hypothetical protein
MPCGNIASWCLLVWYSNWNWCIDVYSNQLSYSCKLSATDECLISSLTCQCRLAMRFIGGGESANRIKRKHIGSRIQAARDSSLRSPIGTSIECVGLEILLVAKQLKIPRKIFVHKYLGDLSRFCIFVRDILIANFGRYTRWGNRARGHIYRMEVGVVPAFAKTK